MSLLHYHHYERVLVEGGKDYFICECGDKQDEKGVTDYQEYLEQNQQEARANGN